MVANHRANLISKVLTSPLSPWPGSHWTHTSRSLRAHKTLTSPLCARPHAFQTVTYICYVRVVVRFFMRCEYEHFPCVRALRIRVGTALQMLEQCSRTWCRRSGDNCSVMYASVCLRSDFHRTTASFLCVFVCVQVTSTKCNLSKIASGNCARFHRSIWLWANRVLRLVSMAKRNEPY